MPIWSKVTAVDMTLLASGLTRVGPVSEDDARLLAAYGRMCQLSKGEHLLCGGQQATQSGMVLEGLLREYFVMSDGTERTKAFVRGVEGTGSLADLLSNRPSRAWIVAEEPSRVFVANFMQLRALAEVKPQWALWTLKLVESMFVAKAEREYELLGLVATDRYEAFAVRYPGLEQRVTARHVASYLGITPVHLSRLRRRRRGRGDRLGTAVDSSALGVSRA